MNLSEPQPETQKPVRLHFQSKKFFEIKFEEQTLQVFFCQGDLILGKAVPHSIEKFIEVQESAESAAKFMMELINMKFNNGYELALEGEEWGIYDFDAEAKCKEALDASQEKKEIQYAPPLPNTITKLLPMTLALWNFIDEINKKAIELRISYEPIEANNSIKMTGETFAIEKMTEFLSGLQIARKHEEEERKVEHNRINKKEDNMGPFMQKELKICNSVKTSVREIEKQADKLQLIYENLDDRILIAGQQANVLEFLSWMYELTTLTMEKELKRHKEAKIIKQNGEFCQNEINISTFHRIHKDKILKKAQDFELICDFGYDVILISGLSEKIKEFKSYLHDVEAAAKKALYPKYWDFHEVESFSEIVVDKSSQEFREVSDLFNKTAQGLRLTKLIRIQNKYLMDFYVTMLQKRQEIRNEGHINRKLLFHGTRTIKPELIYKSLDTGFDLQYANAGGSYGKGLYFAVDAISSQGYSYNTGNGKSQMLLADVFVGNAYKSGPNSKFLKAPKGYDSVKANDSFYIIYNNFHSYPLYLIECENAFRNYY